MDKLAVNDILKNIGDLSYDVGYLGVIGWMYLTINNYKIFNSNVYGSSDNAKLAARCFNAFLIGISVSTTLRILNTASKLSQ